MQFRILSVANVPPDPNSGAGGTVYQTNVALRELGHEVVGLWKDDLGPRRIAHGNLYSLLEQPRRYRDAVLSALKRQSYDVIQMSQPQAWLTAQSLRRKGFEGIVINRSHGLELRVDDVVPKWHRRLGVPETHFPRSLVSPLLRGLLQRQWSRVVQYCDGVVFSCDMDRQFLVSRFPEAASKSFTVHEGVTSDFTISDPPLLTPQRLRKLLYVGQHAFIKGHYLLTEILNRSLRDNPELTCTWVTSAAAHGEVRARLDESIRERVTLLDWRPQPELIELYDQHGVFVFPTLFEGFGKVFLEALARRMYVISADTGGMHECLAASQGGALCGVGQVDEFCDAIRAASTDPTAAIAAAERGHQMAREMTWQVCAEKLTAIYTKLAASRHRSGGMSMGAADRTRTQAEGF